MTVLEIKSKSGRPRLGWTYIPLIAYGIIVLGLMAPFIYISPPEPLPPDYYGTLIFIFTVIALAHLALVGLFAVTRWMAKKNWPEIGWVQTAMWSSLITMSVLWLLPMILLISLVAFAGGDVGAAVLFGGTFLAFIFVLPIFGLIGWFAGRRRARRMGYSEGRLMQSGHPTP